MNKKEENSASDTLPIDAAAFIASVDAEALEKQIEGAEGELAKAQGKLRSLLSLKKMVDWRDGKRWARKKKEKTGEPSPARSADAIDYDELANRIEAYLRKQLGPANVNAIARGVGCANGEAESVLKSRSDLYQKTGMGVWELVDEE